MCNKLFYLVSFVLVVGLAVGVTNAVPLQQDSGSDGIVSVEAENFDTNVEVGGHTWMMTGPHQGFLGELGMFVPPTSGAHFSNYAAEAERLEYEINFVKTGTHYVWILAWGLGPNNNSCHVGLDGKETPLSNHMTGWTGVYKWSNDRNGTEPSQFEITSTGLHTLNIWARQIGVIIDKIVLTTNPNFTLSGSEPGPPESVRGGTQVIAYGPNPSDGAAYVPRDVILSWESGAFANTHDVYLGTVFEYVNDADRSDQRGVLASQGQIAATYDPGLLDFGQTYFWRVDEVNAPPDYTVFKGDVWSFTVEPFAYPIENITATASSANRTEEGPENTVNGSGLDGSGLLHGNISIDNMWLSNIADPNVAWIQYEFDRVHKLYQMWVWNYNSSVEPIIGFGVKEATIEYSVDGTNWAILGTTHEFARGSGSSGYAPNTTVDLSGVSAKYVKITANSNWGGIVNQYGLSEVRFLYVPVWATKPSPDSGATGVGVDAILNWRAGREAVKHDVYLNTDEQAVIDGNVPVTTVTEAGYAPSLDLAGTYYWRIDEVNDIEIPTTWQGDIWNLSTQEYLVVDDFESYNDIPAGEEGSNLVYVVWKDGLDNPSVNGSTMGYNEPFQPTIETSLVYDGKQSVPLFYDNTVAAYSEVTANVADLDVGRDWTRHGIKALTLRFLGDPNNSLQQMYVKINGSRVTYDGSAEDTRLTGWQMWYIDLASIGVSLSNVTELAIGFERIGAAGGQGMVLLDGIRLYSYDRQLITPADPGAVGLQAHYEFEGNTNDSSGNARNGTAMGNPTVVGGRVG